MGGVSWYNPVMNNMLVKSVSPPAKTIQRMVYTPSNFCIVTKRKQIPMLLHEPNYRYSVKN
jgi:hypothetical protein